MSVRAAVGENTNLVFDLFVFKLGWLVRVPSVVVDGLLCRYDKVFYFCAAVLFVDETGLKCCMFEEFEFRF